jgi:hypothetical protein
MSNINCVGDADERECEHEVDGEVYFQNLDVPFAEWL